MSRRKTDGTWETPRNLGPKINTADDETFCISAADGEYLFFKREKIMHWVRSTAIAKAAEYPCVTNAVVDRIERVGRPLRLLLPDSFAIDRSEATLTLTATLASGEPLPSWLRFDPAASSFTGVPPSVGDFRIRVRATDERQQAAFNDLTLHVVDAYSPPAEPANLQKGLLYSYYEGRWDKLPDFSTLRAKKTGVVENFNLDAWTSFHNLAFVFEGFFAIKSEGFYRFFLNANGGARLLVDGHVIVDHDELHHVRESAVGAAGLKPGKHKLIIQYFKQHRVPDFKVSYGGEQTSNAYGMAVDDSGDIYLTGATGADGFPTVNEYQTCPAPGLYSWDAFVLKLSSTGDEILYSTFLGGAGVDEGRGIAVDAFGRAYVTGFTHSSEFPTFNPLQGELGAAEGIGPEGPGSFHY